MRRRQHRCKGVRETAEKAVRSCYRKVVAGVAVVLLVAAGIMILMDNSESVLQEKSVKASEVYSFSFVTQENETVSSGNDKGVKDSAVRPIVDSDEVYYSDSFFRRPNTEYDHELARASLALSMTAFKEEHVLSFLEDLGYKEVVSYRYDQTGDENKVALVMGHKSMAVTDASDGPGAVGTPLSGSPEADKTIIAIAIRGGKYGDEWGSNGRVGYDGESFGYHYGFHEAAEDAIVQLKEYASDNSLDLGESVIWITGFSRGAAAANVMGAMLTGNAAAQGNAAASGDAGDGRAYGDPAPDGTVSISPENLFDYTFASPSTVSESLLAESSKISAAGSGINASAGIYNIVNPLDIVTRLPMNARGSSESSNGKMVKYNWDYTKYGTTLQLPAESETAQLQVVDLLENALAFATRNESQYVEKTQDQVIIPALKKTMGKGADVSKRNVGFVLIDSLPGVTAFLKDEVDRLDLRAQLYVAGILSGRKNLRLEKEHWPETYWGWMMKTERLE